MAKAEPTKFPKRGVLHWLLRQEEFRSLLHRYRVFPLVDPETRVVQFVTQEWAEWKMAQTVPPPPPSAGPPSASDDQTARPVA